MTLEDVGWALWQRQQKRRVPLGFWCQLWKETETWHTPTETETWHTPAELPATRHVHSAPPGGASQEGTAYHSRPPFLSCGGVRMRFLDPSTMTKRCACLQQRSTLPASPLSLEMWVLLSPVGYVDPPVAPTPILVVTTVTCREGVEDAPWSTDAWKR